MNINEGHIVDAIISDLTKRGYKFAAEVAHYHRSVDILARTESGELWAIECKISDISRAITQSKTHLLSADKVFIATLHRKTKTSTLRRIKEAGIGLFYVQRDGSVDLEIDPIHTRAIWDKSRTKLLARLETL